MKALFYLLIIGYAAAAAGQTYKWTDDRGGTTYGSKPPPGRSAELVDTRPQGPADLSPDQQKRFEDDARRRASVRAAPPPAPAPAAGTAPAVRGMAFDTYIRLERGMSEGELVLRAGGPDHVSTVEAAGGYARLYYYMPTASDPFTTIVTLRGGRIDNLERTRKF